MGQRERQRERERWGGGGGGGAQVGGSGRSKYERAKRHGLFTARATTSSLNADSVKFFFV